MINVKRKTGGKGDQGELVGATLLKKVGNFITNKARGKKQLDLRFHLRLVWQ